MSTTITGHQTTTLVVNQSNQNWVVDIGGSIEVANGHGILNPGGLHHSVIAISGDVMADGKNRSGIFSDGASATLQVDKMGSIHAYNGMAVYGEGTHAENLGTITAANLGIYASAAKMEISNEGLITADTGILINGIDGSSKLTNSGTINGNIGISATGGLVPITLTATSAIDVEDIGISLATAADKSSQLINYGLLESKIAIQGGVGNDYIENHGTVKGTVLLGDGSDSFINVGGTVDSVNGGAGNDYYYFEKKAFKIIDDSGSDAIGTEITVDLQSYTNIEYIRGEGSANINLSGNALANYIEGNDGNNILTGGNDSIEDTITGGKGNDTYALGADLDNVSDYYMDADGSHYDAGIDLITSTISRDLSFNEGIENLTLLGAGNINGTGNMLVNVITGNDGNNVLSGGVEFMGSVEAPAVIDTLNGGKGDDTYDLFDGFDKVIDSAGIDTITSTITRSLADYPTIENLTLLGNGNINGTGNALANVIIGNDANNTLDGGVDTVVDTLNGGAGNDTYMLGAGTDKVVETTGIDTITSTITRSLAGYANVENLTLVGNANIDGTGNALANVITGNNGNNILNGGADTVVDTLKGGAGNDTYILDSGSDVIADGEGIDTITSTITRNLADYALIENLTLKGAANINGTGNVLSNVIIGTTGNNILDGGSDNVLDTLSGDAGNDTYVLGSGNDKVVDGIGTDTITSTITRSLADYALIENLMLKGAANINGTGNALANVIIGNAGNNILDGGSDNVLDTLSGDAGNDTYVLGSGNDKVVDSAGTDTITSSITRSLASYATIENLTLTGTANINATGNALNNVLTGNSGMNTLDGGAGNDTYVLGSGADKVVDSAGIDTITSSITRSLASYATIENLTLTGTANINATGNALNNVLTGNSGMNTLDGGVGNDTYVLGAGLHKVMDSAGIDTITSTISRDLTGFATVEGLKLLGTTNINATGNALANTLTGNSGNNTLSGGDGKDVLIGGAGADKLDGGEGTDTVSYVNATAGLVANLANAVVNTGDAKGDTYISVANLIGSNYNDTLVGAMDANVLMGGTGADKLTGGLGADTFFFKAAGDTTLAVAGQDVIFDFSHSQGDKISLSEIDANSAVSGDQGFFFKGTAAFSGTNGELRFEKQASHTYVYGDINGDKVADFAIHIESAISLQAGDFLV